MTAWRKWVLAWAVGGVVAILIEAIVRLSWIAHDAWQLDWHAGHWVTLVVWTAGMMWGEGYRSFQKYVAPRVVVRSRSLAGKPLSLATFFAPLYALSFFGDEPRALRIAWGVAIFITAFAFSIHFVPHPWRGIIDVGVVAALSWGVIAIVREALRT